MTKNLKNFNLLFEQIKNRNRKSFQTFFNFYYQPLVIYANSYLADQAASEDLVQEVFIYIWENAKKIEIKHSIKAYLYRMVRNRCLNFLKSIKLTDSIDLIELHHTLEVENRTDDFIEEKRQKEMMFHIKKITEQFPAQMLKIFELKFLHNYKYKEIAEELNISINTVKTQLKRAKSKINRLLVFIAFFIS